METVHLRHTDRRPVAGDPVGPDDLAAITTAVEAEGTWLHIVRPDQVLDLAAAADQSHRTEAAESAWQAEMAYWTGGTRPTRSGRPLSACWLTATELGVSVLPLNATVEVAATRQAMRVLLASTGHPYLVLRLGTVNSDDPGPPRRPGCQPSRPSSDRRTRRGAPRRRSPSRPSGRARTRRRVAFRVGRGLR